jgi:hypothetical protein
MINLSQSYQRPLTGIVTYTIPAAVQVPGPNGVTLTDDTFTPFNYFQYKIDQGYNVVPVQFVVFNAGTTKYTKASFLNENTVPWGSECDLNEGQYTVIFPIDRLKGNHLHIDFINQGLRIQFTTGATLGAITATVLFNYWR